MDNAVTHWPSNAGWKEPLEDFSFPCNTFEEPGDGLAALAMVLTWRDR